MYPEVVPLDGNIELVQNSGVQFIDYDVLMDFKCKDDLSLMKAIATGYFVRFAAAQDEPLVRLVPKISSELIYIDPINSRAVDQDSATYAIPLRQSLELYDGVWLPLPYLPDHINQNQYGPLNWARARIVKVDDVGAITKYCVSHGLNADEIIADCLGELVPPSVPGAAPTRRKPSKAYYRVVLAFDTKTQPTLSADDVNGYLAPTARDVESGVRFKLAYTADRCQSFLKNRPGALPWVREWAEAVFRDLYQERIEPRMLDEMLQEAVVHDHAHEAHYLNVLAFLGFMVKPQPVHFIANHTAADAAFSASDPNFAKMVNVSLILDIGNARSCGIMVEDHPNATRGDDDFSDTYGLVLRDLNAPEQVYSQAFVSRIEFARPNFDYDNRSARSGRSDAFSWPSMVRVGTEANNLAAHRHGNEGTSGLTSPKRYLWNIQPLTNDRWVFNHYSYQIKSPKLQAALKGMSDRAYLNSVGSYFNTEGKAYFALDADDTVYDNLESCYSNRSTMTFMLIEIFLQAMVQMNSLSQRQQCTSKNTPRRLKAIILTTPPSMPAEERELYRACVYEALGILWKSLGLDLSPANVFNFGSRDNSLLAVPIPEVYLDWNEAEAGQVVYLYNESQKTFQGNCKAFVAGLRRSAMGPRLGERLVDGEGMALLSARIASVDIGGGTTDLVIKDYTFRRDVNAFEDDIRPNEVYKDGFKIAGDDVVHDLIRECIVTRLAYTLAANKINFKPILQQLVGEGTTGNVRTEMLRAQFTQQVLVKLAYKILFHLEHLDPYAPSCVVKGTVTDFLLDREVNAQLAPTVKRMGPYELPSAEVIAYADNLIKPYLPAFSIMDYKLSFDIAKINRALVEGSRFNICRILTKMAEVLTVYQCDLLLLTGRCSKLPGIYSFFLQRLNIPSSRIIPMHRYRCESWYPFQHDGEFIGDPKTTAAVGALLCYLRLSHDKFPNFRFYSYPAEVSNNAHYVGIIDNSNIISPESVLYRYESARMVARQNQSCEDDEDSNFVAVGRDDEAFKTQLSVELGYRLLDDPTVEATPLFKIEALDHIDEIYPVRKALALTFRDIDRASVQALVEALDFELQGEVKQQAEQYLTQLENLEAVLAPRKAELEQQLLTQVTAEVNAAVVAPSGLKGFFANKDKLEAERQAQISALYAERYNEAVLSAYSGLAEQKRNELEDGLNSYLCDALSRNIDVVRKRYRAGFEQLLHKLNVERVQFAVTLKTVNRHSPYPLAFIKRNLPRLKQVESFELESVVADDGRDYTPYFKMYLKTISGAHIKYFMDSGTINLSGLNPRLRL